MIRIFADHESLSFAAAEYVASQAEEAIRSRGRFTWLLAGGRTPEAMYRILAGTPFRDRGFWRGTHIFWGDERCVPPDDGQSNYFLAKRCFLDHVAIPPEQIHRIEAEAPERDAAAEAYEALLPARPDLLLLGMGADGHTASLFPYAAALDESERRVVPAEAPVEPKLRITITPAVFGQCRRILVLASGPAKAQALQRVFCEEGDVRRTPARLVRDAEWFVDRAATKGLVHAPPAPSVPRDAGQE